MNKKLKLEILKKYYKIDDSKKEIEIALTYDNFSMLVDNNFGDENVEKLNGILFEQLRQAIEEIPPKYKINISITFKDLENYDRCEVERIILENLLFKQYTHQKKLHKTLIISLLMIVFGALFIVGSALNTATKFFPAIVSEIINISGTLLVWQGAATILIDRAGQKFVSRMFSKKIKYLTINYKNESSVVHLKAKKELQ